MLYSSPGDPSIQVEHHGVTSVFDVLLMQWEHFQDEHRGGNLSDCQFSRFSQRIHYHRMAGPGKEYELN